MERGATMQYLLKEITATAEQLAKITDDDDCLAMAEGLKMGGKMLGDCMKWMLVAFGGGNFHLASAGSVSFLRLTGIVVGAWLMGRSALIAKDRLAKGEGNRSFYEAKIVTARFYNDYILYHAPGYAKAITSGGYSVLALKEDQFSSAIA